MRRLAIALAVLLGLVLVVVALGPNLVGRQLLEPQLAAAVRAATGRELTIEGDLRFSLLPSISFAAEGVRVANAPGAAEPDLFRLASLSGRIRLLPLLRGQVVVEHLLIEEPVAHLEVFSNGRPNWQSDTPSSDPAPPTGDGGGGDLPISDLTLADVRLQKGVVTYRDAGSAQVHEAREIELALSLPDLSQPLSLSGTLVANGEPVTLDAGSERPRALLEGGSTPVKVALAAAPARLGYDGSIQAQPEAGLNGRVNIDVPSVGRLLGWIGQQLPAGQTDPGVVKAEAVLALAGAKLDLERVTLAGKALQLEAKGSVDAGHQPLRFHAEVDLKAADIDAYLPAEAPTRAAVEPAQPATAPGGWSEAPLDLEALKLADGQAQLRIGEMRYRGLPLRGGAANLALEGGVLTLVLDGLGAAGGTLGATARVDGAQATPAVNYEAKVTGVQARPLLHALASTDRLSGTAEVEARGAAQGGSVKALVETLDGDGRLRFLDGAIHGINVAAAIRQARQLGLQAATGETQSTDFAELGGSFTITDGIVDNRDFAMQAPLLRLGGAGRVALPPRSLDYQVVARLVGTLEGQGGQADPLVGLPIPVRITGTFDRPAYSIDWQSVLREAAKDPARLARLPQDLRGLGANVGVNIPLPGGPAADQGRAAGEVVRGLARGLLGNR